MWLVDETENVLCRKTGRRTHGFLRSARTRILLGTADPGPRLLSEPEQGTLAEAMHYLKLSFAKRLRGIRLAQVSVQKTDANLGHPAGH